MIGILEYLKKVISYHFRHNSLLGLLKKSILKFKPEHKKYIRPVAATILMVLGIVFLFFPFIPLGYIFMFAALLLLAPYLPPVRRFLDYLRRKDNKDRVGEVEEKIAQSEEKFDEKYIRDQ